MNLAKFTERKPDRIVTLELRDYFSKCLGEYLLSKVEGLRVISK